MFDLERAIADWRRQMQAGGIKSPVPLNELEEHLRDSVERQVRSGISPQTSFENTVRSLGLTAELRREFNKLDRKNWNRKLAFAAWAMFAVSFVLPAYTDLMGWWCAISQRIFWDDAIHGHWPSINYELLTLANVLMLASPLILFRFGNRPGAIKWFRRFNLAAVLLVWAFIGLLLSSANDRHGLKIGCYVWGLSFVVLQASTLRLPVRKRQFAG